MLYGYSDFIQNFSPSQRYFFSDMSFCTCGVQNQKSFYMYFTATGLYRIFTCFPETTIYILAYYSKLCKRKLLVQIGSKLSLKNSLIYYNKKIPKTFVLRIMCKIQRLSWFANKLHSCSFFAINCNICKCRNTN